MKVIRSDLVLSFALIEGPLGRLKGGVAQDCDADHRDEGVFRFLSLISTGHSGQ